MNRFCYFILRRMLTLVLSGLSFVSVQHCFASGLFKENENEKKEMTVSSESSSLLQTDGESGGLLYPDDPSLPDGTPIGLPVDGSLAIALFFTLLSAFYIFIKQRQVLFFRKYIIRYSTMNTHIHMKRIFLLIAVCILTCSATAQEDSKGKDLTGAWVLEHIEIYQHSDKDSTLINPLLFLPNDANTGNFDTLFFFATHCSVNYNYDYVKMEYTVENNILKISVDHFNIEFFILECTEDFLHLYRKFSITNSINQKLHYSLKLHYKHQKN